MEETSSLGALVAIAMTGGQHARQIVPSPPPDPMLGGPRADPEEKRGPASGKMKLVT